MVGVVHERFDDITQASDLTTPRTFTIGSVEYTYSLLKAGGNVDENHFVSPSKSIYNNSSSNRLYFGLFDLNRGVIITDMKRIPASTDYSQGHYITNDIDTEDTRIVFASTRAMADRFSISARSEGTGLGWIYEIPYTYDVERWYTIKSYAWRDESLGGYRIASYQNGVLMHNVLIKFSKVADMGRMVYVGDIPPVPGYIDNVHIINSIPDEVKSYLNNLGYETLS